MNRSDNAIRVLTTLAVLVVAGIAAVISFVHIEHLAVTHGQTVLAAMLLPLSIDGTVAASSLVMLRSARMKLPVPKLARVMLVLAVLATLACNVLFGAGFGIVGALLSGWPAVAFIGCAEMAIGMIRCTATVAGDVAEDATADDTALTVAQAVPGRVADDVPNAVPEAGRTVPPGRARRRAVDAHARKAERRYAGQLTQGGGMPSLRSVMADLHVGQDKARAILAHLASLTASGEAS